MIHSISYPVIISVRNFAEWDKSTFGTDNDLIAVPGKSEVRKAIREGLIHLTLATMLSDGQLGSDPDVEEVATVYKRVESNISRMIPSSKSIEERDYILAKAYNRALKDYSRRNTKLKKFLDKNKSYLEVPNKKKGQSTKKKRTVSQNRKKKRTVSQNRKMKAQIKTMIKDGKIRELSKNPRNDEDFVSLYLSSASLSQSKAKTESTKKKARSNRRKLLSIIKK